MLDGFRPLRRRRTLLALFALSFALRFGLLAILGRFDLPPYSDEVGYLIRARAIASVGEGLFGQGAIDRLALDRAYGHGIWPPLHPLLLALGLAFGGHRVWAARLVVALLSALTTLLVHRLTSALAGPRSALAAGLVHALHPSFLAYSHYLWSETTFLFVLFAALVAACPWAVSNAAPPRTPRLLACGALVGLMALTRAAALPLLAVIPLWLLTRPWSRRVRLRSSVLVAATIVATLAPWQTVLERQEGQMPILSTATGFNLLMANNPWQENGDEETYNEVRARAHSIARRRGETPDEAARHRALETIRERPARFALHVLHGLRALWNLDAFAARHLLGAIYPPIPGRWTWVLLGLLALVQPLGLGAATLGARSPGFERSGLWLLLSLLAASCLAPAVTVSNSRMGLPGLALLLPLVGHGIARGPVALRRPSNAWLCAVVTLLSAANLVALARSGETIVRPSSYHRRVVAAIDDALGSTTVTTDCLVLGAPDDSGPWLLRAASPGYRFAGRGRRLEWSPASRRHLRVEVRAATPRQPLRLELVDPSGGVHPFEPVRARLWQTRAPIPGTDVTATWCGAIPNSIGWRP